MPKFAPGLLALLVVGSGAHAVTLLTATLTNGQENPATVPTLTTGAPRPASFGTATFIINDAMTSMTFSATINNIDFTGTQTADINDNLGNAHIHASPTAVPGVNAGVVWGFFGSPLNDNAPNDVVFTPFLTGVGGLRGQITLVPEPETYALMLAGLAAGFVARRRAASK
jgi:hypothetical protein